MTWVRIHTYTLTAIENQQADDIVHAHGVVK